MLGANSRVIKGSGRYYDKPGHASLGSINESKIRKTRSAKSLFSTLISANGG